MPVEYAQPAPASCAVAPRVRWEVATTARGEEWTPQYQGRAGGARVAALGVVCVYRHCSRSHCIHPGSATTADSPHSVEPQKACLYFRKPPQSPNRNAAASRDQKGLRTALTVQRTALVFEIRAKKHLCDELVSQACHQAAVRPRRATPQRVAAVAVRRRVARTAGSL